MNRKFSYFFAIATVFSLPLYMVRFSIFGVPTNILELLAICTIFFTCFDKRLFNFFKKFPLNRQNHMLIIGMALLLTGSIVSAIVGGSYRVSFGIIKGWIVIPMSFFFMLAFMIDNFKERSGTMLKTLFLSSFFTSVAAYIYGLYGFVTFDNRLSAFFESPNQLALFLSPSVIIGAYFITLYYMRRNKISFLSYGAATFFITLIIFFTKSYGACIALSVSFFLAAALAYRKFPSCRRFFATISLLGILLIGFFAVSQLDTEKFNDAISFSERSSASSRLMIWKSGFLMLRDHPFFGIGPGMFQKTYLDYQKYFPPYLEWAVPQPHNLFLAFWLQTGMLGLVGFCLVFYISVRSCILQIKNNADQLLALALFGIFVYIFIHGLVDTPYWKNDLAFMFWIFAAIALTLRFRPSSDRAR